MEPDFSGWATKAGLKCSDGRTIQPDAFKHMHGKTVPLVWQHGSRDPENILGHAVLEARDGSIYTHAYFNETESGKNAKLLVKHGDITNLSIRANRLVEKVKDVLHGHIQEVSLVLSGANPGALIDNVNIVHADGMVEELEDEVIVYTGLELEHEDTQEDSVEPDNDPGEATVKSVYESLSDEQKDVVHYMIGAALEAAAADDDDDDLEQSDEDDNDLEHEEGEEMSRNVFESNNESDKVKGHELTHSDIEDIVQNAARSGSLKAAVEDYAIEHGIDNIDVLFPDAKSVSNRPEWVSRRMEWVSGVLSGTRHTPFSRIKSTSADLTFDEARAKGYVKGNMKKEQFFEVAKRVTTPQTVYKKQKLDRDDIIDITDFDVVAWIKEEMRVMLDEEIARAVLVGDGRDISDDDKIKETNIRPIASDDDFYAAQVYVNIDDANSTYAEVEEAILTNRHLYRGSGNPTMYTSEKVLTKLLLQKDTLGRRLYSTEAELAAALRVSKIVPVEVFEEYEDLLAIIVNLTDYTLGSDKGGNVSMFDDFDIDYNQYKYLIETRLSGALTKWRSAMVIRKTAGANVLVTPVAPAFNQGTNTITIDDQTGVVFKIDDVVVTESDNPIVIAENTTVTAEPDSGYYFSNNIEDEWHYTYKA